MNTHVDICTSPAAGKARSPPPERRTMTWLVGARFGTGSPGCPRFRIPGQSSGTAHPATSHQDSRTYSPRNPPPGAF